MIYDTVWSNMHMDEMQTLARQKTGLEEYVVPW